MGLDMYITASKYIGGWDHGKTEEQENFKKILDVIKIKPDVCNDSPWLTIETCVAYWRKANAVHTWFVNNAQEGKDDCQRYYVSREQLQELSSICQNILKVKEPEKAMKLAQKTLPPQAGFFFGSTEIDEGYQADLENTISQLQRVLNNKDLEGFDLYYQASW